MLGRTRVALALILLAAGPATAEPVSGLRGHTHIHGLAVDRNDPAYLFIATHHGLYRAGPDGEAERVSIVQDFMGFSPHPSDGNTLYASGHPAGGGNLGLIASGDGGRTWTQVSPGANGPVDFHQMTVSPADPATIYGAYGGLQMSRDGGNTWTIVAPAPDRLIGLAASSRDAEVVYAATERGLLLSLDAGKTWKPLIDTGPVTMVKVTADGTMYAFLFGQGLATAKEGVFNWTVVSADWDQDYILHLAVDPADPGRMFAATGKSEIVASGDRGRTWSAFGE